MSSRSISAYAYCVRQQVYRAACFACAALPRPTRGGAARCTGLLGRLVSALLCAFVLIPASSALASPPYDSFVAKVAALEKEHGGRLGVAMLRTKDNTWYTYRGDERFALCSVFKVVAVAQLLQQSASQPELLQKRIDVNQQDIMPFSFAIHKYLNTGISLGQIGQICLLVSDNTAANLLLRELGGPQAVTDYARTLGDAAFRIDRWEMEMNSAEPGDERDTTTPLAMAQTLHKLVLGDGLPAPQRDTLRKWMVDCLTGGSRLPAGTPKSWTVAQKTGTGDYGATNAIGILWPPVGSPLVLAVFYTRDTFDAKSNNAIIAAVAKLATQP